MVHTPFDMLTSGKGVLITCALVILCSFSAYISVEGVLMLANASMQGLAGTLKTFLLGVALWVMFYLLWDLCLSIIPKAGRSRVVAICMMLFLVVPVVFGSSTTFGTTGLAGDAPQEHHMQNEVDQFDAVLTDRLPDPVWSVKRSGAPRFDPCSSGVCGRAHARARPSPVTMQAVSRGACRAVWPPPVRRPCSRQ